MELAAGERCQWGFFVRLQYVRKISQTGVAICLWCKETLHLIWKKKRNKLHEMQNKEKYLENKEMFLKSTTIQVFDRPE